MILLSLYTLVLISLTLFTGLEQVLRGKGTKDDLITIACFVPVVVFCIKYILSYF